MKALDRNGPAFSSLCEKFPRLSMEKIKEGVFISPQIHQLFRDPQLDLILGYDEKAACNAFQHITTGFLGQVKAVIFRKLVEDLLTTCYEKPGRNTSPKMHFLHSHIGSFLLTVVP
jgi:hypothetical protein